MQLTERALLKRRHWLALGRPVNLNDNAQTGADWSTFKTELLPYGGAFATLAEARLEVAHYLDTYSNPDLL